MPDEYDFIVIGGGSAGAVIASRLSEDPRCRVALIEAGERPPEVSALPIAPAAMQLNPATDWMFTADPGKAGLGLNNRRVPVPRGKMLGGSSGINYMMYVRGNPGDFDAWAEDGATGWSYAEVLPFSKRARAWRPVPTLLSTRRRIVGRGCSASRYATRSYRRRYNSLRRRAPLAFPRATTMAATVVIPEGSRR
jgi:choline dehydrogenase-like flavoprotein